MTVLIGRTGLAGFETSKEKSRNPVCFGFLFQNF